MKETIGSVSIVGLIIGLVEVLKRIGFPPRYAPLASVGFGLILGLATMGVSVDGVIGGIVVGLSASGLYDTGKKTILGK